MVVEQKLESGAIVDQKEKLRANDKKIAFRDALRDKYGKFGAKILISILDNIYEAEKTMLK